MSMQEHALDSILNRSEPTFLSLLIREPLKTLAKWLYAARQHILTTTLVSNTNAKEREGTVTVVCVSDTHNLQPQIPQGDIFIHAGDLTQCGSKSEIQAALDWINRLPHKHEIIIAGNHDMFLDKAQRKEDGDIASLHWGSIIYLENSSTVIRCRNGRSFTIYGTPFTRKHGPWCFQYERGMNVFTKTVAEDTDILISHSPPRFHLDLDGLGDDNLLNELWRVRPKLHVFGHIHAGYGVDLLQFDAFQQQYERIWKGSGAIRVWYLARMSWSLFLLKVGYMTYSARVTRAVNVAAIGGLRDTLRREPVIARI